MRDFQTTYRSSVHAARGMVATAQPYATLAGLDMLKAGGSAADAAVAAAAVLAVVEPMSTGIGGDAFCLVGWRDRAGVEGYNGSGAAPFNIDPTRVAPPGALRIPLHSPHAVTIPGAVDLWCALHERHGKLDLARVLAPAITLARDGFVVSPRIGSDWALTPERLAADQGSARHLLVDGRAPAIGEVFVMPALARTLESISAQGRAGFYQGAVAHDMVHSLTRLGGFHTLEDFASHCGAWVDPITSTYRDVEVAEIPPNGQGVTTLLMLNILENFDLADLDPTGPERFHLEIEATRLAYLERARWIADPRFVAVNTAPFLDKAYAGGLAQGIDRSFAGSDLPATDGKRDTTYLAVADCDGMMVSFINSLFHGFGSFITSLDSGVVFQNRGAGFVLDPAHPNHLAQGKRPFHTIIPAMALKHGKPFMAFGVMGGDYQPVGQTHVLTNMVDYAMAPQAALDHPRIFLDQGIVQAERAVPSATVQGLAAKGHRVAQAVFALGGGQIVVADDAHGTWIGASEPRRDGLALGW